MEPLTFPHGVVSCQCLILSQQYVPALTYAIFLISLPLSLGQPMLINTADNTPRSAFLPPLLLKWRCKLHLEMNTI